MLGSVVYCSEFAHEMFTYMTHMIDNILKSCASAGAILLPNVKT